MFISSDNIMYPCCNRNCLFLLLLQLLLIRVWWDNQYNLVKWSRCESTPTFLYFCLNMQKWQLWDIIYETNFCNQLNPKHLSQKSSERHYFVSLCEMQDPVSFGFWLMLRKKNQDICLYCFKFTTLFIKSVSWRSPEFMEVRHFFSRVPF